MKIKLTKLRSSYRKRASLVIMRTVIFLFCTTVFSFTPKSSFSNEKVVINEDQWATIDKVFKIIKEQTKYTFIYKSDLFENYPKVKLKKGVIKADKLLEKTLSQSEFICHFSEDNTIIIKEKDLKISASSKAVTPLQQSVSGTVVDEEGVPLPGVTILIKNTNEGVSSDFDGNYVLNLGAAGENSILIFRYLGFKTQEIVVGSRTNIDVNMVPDLSGLDEVVVIGYGTSKVRDITGTISNISTEEIESAPLGATAESLIQGKAAGVNVTIQSSSPTSPISVIIRGASSLGGTNQPLYVIDGVPQYAQSDDGNIFNLVEGGTSNPFYNLNLNDIKSIDILKDASATAIYGSRAGNGVVLITTKKGSYNTKPVFEVSTQVGVQVADYNDYEYFTRDQYIDFIPGIAAQEYLDRESFIVSEFFLDQDAFSDLNTSEIDADSFTLLSNAFNTESQVTDWLDLLTQSPITTNHNFSVRGGSENTSYFTSFGYNKTEGIIRRGESERYSGRINFDTKFSKNYKFGLNLNGSTREVSDKDGILEVIRDVRPDFPAFNPDGTIFTTSSASGSGFTGRNLSNQNASNPLLDLENLDEGQNVLFQGTAFFEARFLKNFVFKTAYSNTYNNNESLDFQFGGNFQLDTSEREFVRRRLSSNIWENTLSYKNVFNGKHDVSAVAGYTKERSSSSFFLLQAADFPDGGVLINFNSATYLDRASESESENALVSQFVRAQYQFDDRYIISGTVRRDGSSRFGSDRRWGTFPSGAIAWTITGEEFMQSEKMKKYVPFLKLRASLGITGGQPQGDFDHLSIFTASLYNGNAGIVPGDGDDGGLGNRNLQWEETELLDLGLDFSLFNDRLSGTLGKYRKRSRDIIFRTPIAGSSSFNEVTTNIGAIDNEGYEITLKYDLIRSRGGHNLSLNFNWSTNDTEVKEINGDLEEILFPDVEEPFQRLIVGGRTDEWWGFQTANRFYDTAEEAASFRSRETTGGIRFLNDTRETQGDIIPIDQNGDGEITDEDRVNLGSAVPDGFGGFGLSYSYKNFTLNSTFVYAYGHKRLWRQPFNGADGVFINNLNNSIVGQGASVLDVRDATFPRTTLFGEGGNAIFADTYLFDASYLRLNQVSISYSIPKEVFRNSPVSSVDVTLQGTNLFIITDYPGIDPQGNFGNTELGSGLGVDESTFPQTQNYSLGIRVTLQ